MRPSKDPVEIGKIMSPLVADGALDTATFNANAGYLRTTFATPGLDNDQAYRVGVLSTGKIIAAGDTSVGGPNHMFLERINSNGTLDTSIQIPASSFSPSTVTAFVDMVIANDKIYILGRASSGGSCFINAAIAVYKADLTPDTSFGTGGFKSFNAFTGTGCTDQPSAMAVQPDGKIVIAAFATDNMTQFFSYIARFNTDGSIDGGFGGTVPLGGVAGQARFASLTQIYDLVIQPDSVVANPPKIVAGGGSSGTGNFTMYRFTSIGALDPGFGAAGTVITNFGNGSEIHSLALYSDGRILAAGQWGGTLGNGEFALARYSRDGAADTFGTAGKVTTDMSNGQDTANFVGIMSTGKIIATGAATGGAVQSIGVARYNTNGSLDDGTGTDSTPGDSFGTAGKTLEHLGTTSGNNNLPTAPGGALQTDDKILVSGQVSTATVNNSEDLYVARFTNAAPTAAHVGVAGRVVTSAGAGLAGARVILTDGNNNSVTALTNSFGYFRFDSIESGSAYVIGVTLKRYSFASQLITVQDEVTDLTITAQ
ncbi:MAG TPA: carboxypeptidase regulatory-like domain-containing protein [Pyrinomonadaceae bacterium]|nr:carboxypeptidase regulatory-like domain-containing protein [Pyrinomonadaceae bacterium]